MMPPPVRNKIAFITGGSGTIGKAIANVFLSNNISVILTGRTLSKLEETKRTLKTTTTTTGNNTFCHVIQSDISKEDNVIKLFQEIDQMDECVGSYGVDIVVNNAGINVTANSIEELTAKDMEDVLGVNVVGAFLCAREAIKRMKQKDDEGSIVEGEGGRGRIINIGSISSTSPRPNSTAYTTSKFAIDGLTKSLSLDCREHGIAVGIIHPGNVISDLLSPEDVEVRGRTEGFLTPDDVAKCVFTMASLPYNVNVLELTVMPTTMPFVGRG
jgi:NAD(P)-dependent dehydrogenase (short-subunit alcohol dehydrogenase family)